MQFVYSFLNLGEPFLDAVQFRTRDLKPNDQLLLVPLGFCLAPLLTDEGDPPKHQQNHRRDGDPPPSPEAGFFRRKRMGQDSLGKTRRRLPALQGLLKIAFEPAHVLSPSNSAPPSLGSARSRVADDSIRCEPASAGLGRSPRHPCLHRNEEQGPREASPEAMRLGVANVPEEMDRSRAHRRESQAASPPVFRSGSWTAATCRCSDGPCSVEARRRSANPLEPTDGFHRAAEKRPGRSPPQSQHYGSSYRQCCRPSPDARERRIRNRSLSFSFDRFALSGSHSLRSCGAVMWPSHT